LADKEGEETQLGEVIYKSTIIIYWNSIYCNEYYTDFLDLLNSYNYEIENASILLIGEFNSHREFLMFIKSINNSIESYFLEDPSELIIPIKEGEYPFALIVNSDLKISNIFTIRKTTIQNYQFFLQEMLEQVQISEGYKK
jgi:hypothetical protein